MEQHELDNFWHVIQTRVKPLFKLHQQAVSYQYCLLVESQLDQAGRQTLSYIRKMIKGAVTGKKSSYYQQQLQQTLPDEGPHVTSVLIWALQPDSAGFPLWYSAGIAGLNLVDLGIVTLSELTALTNDLVEKISSSP